MKQITIKEVISKYIDAQRRSNMQPALLDRNETVLLDFFQYAVNADFEINAFDKRGVS